MANTARAVYFWRPEDDDGYLGQWYPSRIVSAESDGDQIIYKNAEQYMMHRKGLLFAPDSQTTAKILMADHPRLMKSLGRAIPNFDEAIWHTERYKIVVEGNYMKFTQNSVLKVQLLATGESELVEASPRDRIWGVGFGKERAEQVRAQWGLNLLGKALMEVRERIRKEEEDENRTPDD